MNDLKNKLIFHAIKVFIFVFLVFHTVILFGQEDNYKVKTVVIDAGHGGKDPGAIGKISQEKTLALAITLYLGEYISKNFPDVKVIYTRDKDIFIPLYERAQIANENNADLFISIHVNASESSRISGTSTYVMGLHKSDDNLDVAKRENSVILYEDDYDVRYEGFNADSPENHIIATLVQDTYLEQSLMFAAKIQEQFKNRAMRYNRGVKQAGLVVLWNSTMPSVLVETGFITNENEEKFLNTTEGQKILASAIFRAFRDYKTMVESNINIKAAELAEMKEKKAEREKGIHFKIQIKSSKTRIPLQAKNFKGLKYVEELHIDGVYKYLFGDEKTLSKIFRVRKQVRQKFKNAFIVAFKNGNPIPYKQAVKEASEK